MAEMVNHPLHYNRHPSGVECIEICQHMTFNLGSAFKYGWRYYAKANPAEDLSKALWYVRQSLDHDNAFLLGNREHAEYFRTEVMTARRRTIFMRPSPWCEPVRQTMASLCDLHSGHEIGKRLELYDKAQTCLLTAIADEQCLGRGLEG